MLDNYLRNFNENISGLREFIELIEPFLDQHLKEAEKEREIISKGFDLAKDVALEKDEEKKNYIQEQLKQLLNGDLIIASEIDKEQVKKDNKDLSIEQIPDFIYSVPKSLHPRIDSSLENVYKISHQKHQLLKSSLISLLSTVEWFFSQVLHFYYDKYPDSAGIKKKTLSLENLKTFGDIKDAEKFLIDQKIEEIFRGGFESWLSILKDEIKIKSELAYRQKDELIEIYQRRNLLVHNGGVVNSIYLTKVPESLRENVKIGDELEVTKEYLENSICKIHLVFTLIASEIWKKIEKKSETREEILNDIVYSNLLENRWDIAGGISEAIFKDRDNASAHRTVAQLNSWLCIKREGKYDSISKEINEVDYSDKALKFQMGLWGLKEDKKKFFSNLESSIKTDELTVENVLEFPIFEEMRKTEEFEKFRKESDVFKEMINIEEKE
ncbi:hypothetical protein [Allomuricauda sp. M10]|uniref:hypothetical protein n=1 Tax=Allomuricauda sp. M10 TaxID=2683292 RepID=UPI001D196EBD|nr:hypothetical protein [Muricauda sp. M10]